MVFAHDTEAALLAAAALVNTAHEDPDALSTPADLDAFAASQGVSGSRTHDRRELDAVREARSRIARLWSSDREEVVRLVNEMLAEANARPYLVRHDEWDYHLHATPPDADLAVRMTVEAAMALVDVIRTGELDRLGMCAAEDCEDVVVDLSRNRSRRFCDSGCGNRANVAAYRARRADPSRRPGG